MWGDELLMTSTVITTVPLLLIIPMLTLEKGEENLVTERQIKQRHTLTQPVWSRLLYSIMSCPLPESTFLFPASPLFTASAGFRCSSLPYLNRFTLHSLPITTLLFSYFECIFCISPHTFLHLQDWESCWKVLNHMDEEGQIKNGNWKTHTGRDCGLEWDKGHI